MQETTEERKKAFEELKAKDDDSAKLIEQQMRNLQRLSDTISQLKSKMSSNSKECDDRNQQLREVPNDPEIERSIKSREKIR